MGYTHYFHKNSSPTPAQREAITSDFNKLLTEVRVKRLLEHKTLPPIEYGDAPGDAPRVDGDLICFNGVGEDAHETLAIGPIRPMGLDFCKTACNPYDIWVTALLVLTHYHAPGCWDIGSDGGAAGMEGGLELVRHLHPDAENPIRGHGGKPW